MNESDLLAHIYRRSAAPGGSILVGPGDDCAVLRLADHPPADVLLTTDQLIEGRHFEPGTPTALIAHKAVARGLSDIAGMGGAPTAALAAVTLNDHFTGADELFDEMASIARAWSCPLIGGDIAVSPSPLALTVTVIGRTHAGRGPVLRSEAQPGDRVCVTGSIGGSLPSGRHLSFEPRLTEAAWLCDTLGDQLGAMIDISDGLGRDAGRVALASDVRLTLDASAIPLAREAEGWRAALADGEDYELLFTARRDPPARTPTGVPIAVIGVVRPGAGCIVRAPDGESFDASTLGWDHHA